MVRNISNLACTLQLHLSAFRRFAVEFNEDCGNLRNYLEFVYKSAFHIFTCFVVILLVGLVFLKTSETSQEEAVPVFSHDKEVPRRRYSAIATLSQ